MAKEQKQAARRRRKSMDMDFLNPPRTKRSDRGKGERCCLHEFTFSNNALGTRAPGAGGRYTGNRQNVVHATSIDQNANLTKNNATEELLERFLTGDTLVSAPFEQALSVSKAWLRLH